MVKQLQGRQFSKEDLSSLAARIKERGLEYFNSDLFVVFNAEGKEYLGSEALTQESDDSVCFIEDS